MGVFVSLGGLSCHIKLVLKQFNVCAFSGRSVSCNLILRDFRDSKRLEIECQLICISELSTVSAHRRVTSRVLGN
jgi:hypothetical protein